MILGGDARCWGAKATPHGKTSSDVGDTLREVFDIYRDHGGVLLPVAFWLFLVVAIVNGLTVGKLSLFWLGPSVSLTVGTLYQGMVVELVRDVQDGRRDSSVGDLMRSVLPVLGPLIGAGILAGLGIARRDPPADRPRPATC